MARPDGRPAPAWGAAIHLGLLPSALGFVLWGHTVARLPVSTSTSLLYLVPAVAVLIASVWLGELPYPSELLGGLVVLAGVVIISRGDHIRQRLAGHVADSPESDLAPSVALSHTGRFQAHFRRRRRIEGARVRSMIAPSLG